MKPFYTTLKKSWNLFYGSFKAVLSVVAVDVVFFICFAVLFSKVWDKIIVHINAVTELMDINLAQLGDAVTESQIAMLAAQEGQFLAHYRQINYHVGMLLFGTFALWAVFQSISWFITNRAAGKKKQELIPYFGKFALLSAVWWVLFVLIMAFAFRLSMYSTMAALPYVSSLASKLIILAALFIIFYLSYTSYALIPHYKMKSLFSELLKKSYNEWKTLLPGYLFMAAAIIGEYYFFMRSFAYGGYAALAFALIIIFPTIAWSRIYAIKLAE